MTGFKSFLSEVGTKFKEVFSWLGSAKGQTTVAAVEGTAAAITTAINPAVGGALTGVESLINVALKEVVGVESLAAAAASQSGTGAQKLSAVVSAISPQVGSVLQSVGVSQPTSTQVENIATVIANSVVAVLNAIPASSNPVVITPAPTPTA